MLRGSLRHRPGDGPGGGVRHPGALTTSNARGGLRRDADAGRSRLQREKAALSRFARVPTYVRLELSGPGSRWWPRYRIAVGSH